MTSIDPDFFTYGLIALGAAIVAAAVSMHILRTRRRARRRTLERPNSHYTSKFVRELEDKHRWHGMALDRLHEINREEVERLLAKIEATSVAALRPNERAFLDRMAELVGGDAPGDAGAARAPADGHPRHLRHRPA